MNASTQQVRAVQNTRHMALREIVLLAVDSFRLNQVRFALTALGMVIGTASLILVVTIGLSGRRYVLTSIQNIGTNLIWAEYAGLSDASAASARDFLTVDDMNAVAEGCDALVIATEWDEFKKVDLVRAKKGMTSPILFDGRNLLDPAELKKQGWTYQSIGR